MGEIVPLIVAIVIGIIYNFFKGMSEKEGEKRKPTIPPKLDPMHPQHFGESKPRTAEPKKAVQTDSVVEIFTEKKQQQIQTKINKQEKAQEFIQVEKPKMDDSAVIIEKLTQKKLIESVVMAEILGAPRALKPHRSSRYSKLSK